MAAGNWCLIESDPGVFTDLIQRIGVPSVEVEELYALDEAALHALEPVYGLIFLFKINDGKLPAWRDSQPAVFFDTHTHPTHLHLNEHGSSLTRPPSEGQPILHDVPGLFFARQIINNACATQVPPAAGGPTLTELRFVGHALELGQAILSVLMNAEGLELGDNLRNFKDFTLPLDPEMRGLTISNSEEIRSVHNSFAPQESFAMESRSKAKDDDDMFHFVAYVPFQGRLYELDGVKEGPIDHGPCGQDWAQSVIPVLQRRIEAYQMGEIRFNLMAICQEKATVLRQQEEELQAQLFSLTAEQAAESSVLEAELAQVQQALASESSKRQRWEAENRRRKHNYVPLFLEMLRMLAQKDKLLPLVADAKRKATARLEKSSKAAKS